MVKINGNRSGEVGRMLGKKMEYLRWFFSAYFLQREQKDPMFGSGMCSLVIFFFFK